MLIQLVRLGWPNVRQSRADQSSRTKNKKKKTRKIPNCLTMAIFSFRKKKTSTPADAIDSATAENAAAVAAKEQAEAEAKEIADEAEEMAETAAGNMQMEVIIAAVMEKIQSCLGGEEESKMGAVSAVTSDLSEMPAQ